MINLTATAPASINLALNQPGSQIAGLITALAARLDSLEPRVTANETNISNLQLSVNVLNAKVTDLDNRLKALETTLLFPGPKVGVIVHLKNPDGDCVSALIYEDPTKRNNLDTVSVVYVDPDNPAWAKRADVRLSNGLPDNAFNFWHQPEYTH